jgi:hypothetical protein
MRKHVLPAVIGLDEAIALLFAEPLHNTGRHSYLPCKKMIKMALRPAMRRTSREELEDLRYRGCGIDLTSDFAA